MSLKYEYSTANSYYVGFTFLLCFLIPFSYFYYRQWKKLSTSTPTSIPLCPDSACSKQRSLLPTLFRQTYVSPKPFTPSSLLSSISTIIFVVGWCLCLFFLYQILTSTTIVEIWDPYETLGLSSFATKEEIRAKYRQLSLTHHPDKLPFHLRSEGEKKFIMISKAYRVLTDAKARKNYEKYGNPDGPKGVTFGMGLPSWILDTNFVVIGYLGILILLPFFFLSGWYRTVKYTSKGILKSSLQPFALMKENTFTFHDLISSLSACSEPLDQELKEEQAQQLTSSLTSVLPSKQMTITPKVLILYAHFMRALPSPYPNFIATCVHLIDAVLEISFKRRLVKDVMASMEVKRSLTMAMLPMHSLLLQLPHVTLPLIQRHFQSYRTPYDLLLMDRHRLNQALDAFTPQQRNELVQACGQYPHVTIDQVNFIGVPGQSMVHTQCTSAVCEIKLTLTTVASKLLPTPASTFDTSASSNSTSTSTKNESVELTQRKLTKKQMIEKKKNKSTTSISEPNSMDSKLDLPLPTSFVCAPYCPLPQSNGFYILLTDTQSILAYEWIECRSLTSALFTCSLSFQPPTQTGSLPLQVMVLSPYWFYQIEKNVILKIVKLSKKERKELNLPSDSEEGSVN